MVGYIDDAGLRGSGPPFVRAVGGRRYMVGHVAPDRAPGLLSIVAGKNSMRADLDQHNKREHNRRQPPDILLSLDQPR